MVMWYVLKEAISFVFGRGSEELEFAQKHHLETEVVPGISSALAVPAGQGIPLTMRHVSESFWVITGTPKCISFLRILRSQHNRQRPLSY